MDALTLRPNVTITDTLGQAWELTQRQYASMTQTTRDLLPAHSPLTAPPERMGPASPYDPLARMRAARARLRTA